MHILIYTITILIGIIAAQFVNYSADILPLYRKFATPICIHCQKPIGFCDYILFKNCKSCNKKRTLRAVIIQVAFPTIFLTLAIYNTDRLNLWLSYLLVIYLGIIFVIDLEYKLILHPTSYAGAIIGLIIGYFLHGFWSTILGGAVGYALMFGFFYIGILFNKLVSKIRKEEVEEVALGFGDVNFAGIMGLLLGYPGIFAGLIFTIFLSGGFSILYIIIKKIKRSFEPLTAIPFAPFMIIAIVILLFRP